MNFNNVFRWHLPATAAILVTPHLAAADTILVLGDSLSAGYRMAANAAWPALLNDKWQAKTPVVNGSISSDTSQQGVVTSACITQTTHQPRWVLVRIRW
jgi:acyl-CoA thioesterase-1